MSKPKIFLSSTYYDLKHIRSSIENFIDSLGYESVLSEKGSIAYNPDIPLDESCYREAQNSDIFVIIIGGRYGSPTSDTDNDIDRTDFYKRYESVTKMEYESALKRDIPIYILIDKAVKSEYETFKKNRDNDTIKYAHVDSINIFLFIDKIIKQNRNNPIKEFDKHKDIEEWLRIQWAGLFKELIRTRSNKTEIANLGNKIGELSNLNTTFKRYLEELITNEEGGEGKKLIKEEEDRLKDIRIKQKLLKELLVQDFMEYDDTNSIDNLITIFMSAKDLITLTKKLSKLIGETDNGKRLYKFWKSNDSIKKDLKAITQILGIDEITNNI